MQMHRAIREPKCGHSGLSGMAGKNEGARDELGKGNLRLDSYEYIKYWIQRVNYFYNCVSQLLHQDISLLGEARGEPHLDSSRVVYA